MISRLYHLDHLYGLLLTFGLALIIQGLFRNQYGISGLPYQIPTQLAGGQNLGFMFLPNYRGWVIVASLVVCLATWFIIEKTRLGAYLRAATENPTLVGAFGINVPRLITLTYGFGVALAAFAGVLAAPIYSVNPNMGADLIIVVFAVVVIGGMGSILGSIVTGFGLGLIEGLTRVFYPEGSAVVIFVIMAIVLLVKPAGSVREDRLMADRRPRQPPPSPNRSATAANGMPRHHLAIFVALLAFGLVAPFVLYPVFLMKVLCFALFACAFNLLLGFGGLLVLRPRRLFRLARAMSRAHAAKVWGLTPGAVDPDRHARCGLARPRDRLARDPPPGHLLRDGDAGLRADGVLLLRCRRRLPAARTASSRCRAATCSA